MIINNNIAGLNAIKNVNRADSSLTKSVARLSSGLRINNAGDDAAGLAISEKMSSQIVAMNMANRNCQDVVSLVQTAEGAMDSISDMLTRLKELTVQAGNGIYSAQDLDNIQLEVTQLIDQIDVVATTLNFNGLNLLDGTFAVDTLNFQIGITPNESISMNIPDLHANALGTAGAGGTIGSIEDIDITNTAVLSENLAVIDAAIEEMTSTRATLGAVQNRAEYTLSNLIINAENLTASESRIKDVDMAAEMSNYSTQNVLLQSGISVLSQANQKTSHLLQLLQ